jgi:crotonobetaine/carnitine-CoA ligase
MVVKALVKGVLTPGYFRNPEATAALYDGEWLRTGDKAMTDAEGNIVFLGRIKDAVRRRGENVSAWEVERVMNEHPAIVESAIVGVKTDIGEEDIKAFVRVKPDHVFDPTEFITWCAGKMAYYQVPRYLATIDAFEVTPTRRIRKENLSRSTGDCWDREAHGLMLKGG